MAMRHVPILVLVLLAAAATFPGVAVAEEEEDQRCQASLCVDGVSSGAQCRTVADYLSCNQVCVENGCDGGSQVGGTFGCPVGNSWILCQCNYCGGGGGTGGGGTGGGETGGGGETCREGDCWLACFEEFACMDFESYCQFGECWCDVYLD